MLCCRCIPPTLHRAYQHPQCPACRTSGCSVTDTKSPQSQNDLRRTLRKRGPSATARGRQNSTQCSTHRRGCQVQELPASIRPCSGHGGVLGTTRTWGFSQDELACQGSWVINISLHSPPALFLAWGRAVEAFPQLFQHIAALWGARGSQAVPLSALGMHRASSCPSREPEPSPGAEHPSRLGTNGTSPLPLRVGGGTGSQRVVASAFQPHGTGLQNPHIRTHCVHAPPTTSV